MDFFDFVLFVELPIFVAMAALLYVEGRRS